MKYHIGLCLLDADNFLPDNLVTAVFISRSHRTNKWDPICIQTIITVLPAPSMRLLTVKNPLFKICVLTYWKYFIVSFLCKTSSYISCFLEICLIFKNSFITWYSSTFQYKTLLEIISLIKIGYDQYLLTGSKTFKNTS